MKLPYRKPHAMRHSYATWLLVAVEAEDNVVPAELPERNRPPLGAGQLELGRGLAPPERRNDAHSGDFRQGSQPPRGHEMGRRLATFPSIPYAALSRTRHGHSRGGLRFHRPRNRQVDPIPAHPPGARAPGLRGMHDLAELPAAQGLRLAELGGDWGPACQHRIDHLPGLVEGL